MKAPVVPGLFFTTVQMWTPVRYLMRTVSTDTKSANGGHDMASKFRQRYRARMDRQRGIFITANRPRLFASPARFNPLPPITRTILQQLEDRREWHPEGYARPARGWSLPRHRLVMRQSKGEARRSSSSSFQSPFLPSFQSVPIGIGFKAPNRSQSASVAKSEKRSFSPPARVALVTANPLVPTTRRCSANVCSR